MRVPDPELCMSRQSVTRPPLFRACSQASAVASEAVASAGVHATSPGAPARAAARKRSRLCTLGRAVVLQIDGLAVGEAGRAEVGVEHGLDARAVADHVELVGAREVVALPDDLHGRDSAALQLEREREHVVDLAVVRTVARRPGARWRRSPRRCTAGPAMACTRSMPWLARSSTWPPPAAWSVNQVRPAVEPNMRTASSPSVRSAKSSRSRGTQVIARHW